MRVSTINSQQLYKPQIKQKQQPNLTFQGKGKQAGTLIGGLTGLMMCGAMVLTCPVDWTKIKTWPIVAMCLTSGGAIAGNIYGDVFDNTKNNNKK